MPTKIVSLVNKRAELIELQLRSFEKYLLDSNFEYIVVNNARNATLIANALKALAERRFNPFRIWSEWRSSIRETRVNRREISEECTRLSVKEFPIKTSIFSWRSGSAEPSTIVAYSLKETFRQLRSLSELDAVCLIDSDIFLTSAVSFESLLAEKEIALVPQLRGADVVYPWTGFLLARGSFMKKGDFNLGIVRGERTDVGGRLSEQLALLPEASRTYLQFLNFRSIETLSGNGRQYTASLNGNFEAKFVINEDGVLETFEADFPTSMLRLNENFLGIQDSESFAMRFHRSSNFFRAAKFSPLNVDLIGAIGPNDVPFAIHYKNASNPRDFDDQTYFESKSNWIRSLVT